MTSNTDLPFSERNYGTGDPDCPICGGLGYVRYNVQTEDPRFGKIFPCDCVEERIAFERAESLRRTGGLDNYADKTFENFNTELAGLHPSHLDSLRYAYNLAARYAAHPEGWLVLQGSYGCGKTHLAAAIANAQIQQRHKVIFVTVPDLLDYLRAAFGHQTDEADGFNLRFEDVKNTPLLILDDLGIESPTAWAVEKLYQILNYRYNAKLPTIITTNHELQDLERRLRSRLQDQELTRIVAINAPDYRGQGNVSNQSDLNTLGLYSHMTFSAFDYKRPHITPEQGENLRKLYRIAQDYANSPQGWLVFLGQYGSGKTHLAAAIANTCTTQGIAALFVTVPDLLDHLRAAYAPDSSISYDKRFAEVKKAPLLVLDDLGTESATPWAREKLYQLINYRYNAQLPTVFTTSKNLADLDERLVTRMRDKRLSKIIAIMAPAYLGKE